MVAIRRFGFVQVALPPHASGMRGRGGRRRGLRPISGHLGLSPEGQSLSRFIKWHPKEFSYPLADSCGAEQVRLASARGGIGQQQLKVSVSSHQGSTLLV